MFSDYYRSLEDREKLVLWLGAVCGLILLAYLLCRPLLADNERLRLQIVEKQTLVEWMEKASDEARRLQAAGAGIQGSSAPIQQLITRQANLQHLKPDRMKSRDANEAQLWLGDAEFNRVLILLDQLHSDGVILQQAQFSATESPGRVKAQLTFER